MADDVCLNKVAIIERCMDRVRDEYRAAGGNLAQDLTRQDSVVLNLQRACEAAIDLAMHVVSRRRLGVPQESREAFDLLRDAQIIEPDLAARLSRMVGFRNIAVHDYQKLDLAILTSIIAHHRNDFTEFAKAMLIVTS